MEIKAGFEIIYDCPKPTPMLLMLNVHPSREADILGCDPSELKQTCFNSDGESPPKILLEADSRPSVNRLSDSTRVDQTLSEHRLVFDPPIESHTYLDHFGNRSTRIVAPSGKLVITTGFRIEDSGVPDRTAPDAKQIPVEDLPDNVLVFLLGSRYCETDRLSDTAWSLFGETPPGWARVQAICDYVHKRITFGYAHARPTKTAWDAFMEQRGVCRDFAHLAVTFCRCMNIPARYCTGYLGDIGVPVSDAPMDFSAWFEVYLDGQWYTCDARHNFPRLGRILMARGRDATDVAITTTFGPCMLMGFDIVTEEVLA